MIGISTWDYLFIRFCILALHYLAPLCILYTLLLLLTSGLRATTYRIPLLIESLALLETLFYLLIYLPYSIHLQREAVHPPALSRSQRQELFSLCNQNIPDGEAYLKKWFLGAERGEIRRENVKEFFLWAFFNRGGSPGGDEEELEGMVRETEKLLGRRIEEGRGRAECLRLTLDKADMLHRSLTWYWCVGFVDFLTYCGLLYQGFHFHRLPLCRFFHLFPFRPQTLLATKISPVKHLTYWHRPHTSKTHLPILFIHGIGIGLYPYTNFLRELNSGHQEDPEGGQIGIIAIEMMPVSFRLTHPALSSEVMVEEIKTILKHHDFQHVTLVSHSYGTVISTWLLKALSNRQIPKSPKISSLVLIDPVSILLHLPDVAYNFTRRIPRHANEHQLYYFASMDMGVSHTLARHFFWSENVLWKMDLERSGVRRVTVSLAGRDLIVNTQAVGEYLTSGGGIGSDAAAWESEDQIGGLEALGRDQSQKMNGHVNGHTHGHISRISSIPSPDSASSVSSEEEESEEEETPGSWKESPWKGKGLDVLWFDNLDHAQVFDKPATRRPLVRAIRGYCRDGMAEVP